MENNTNVDNIIQELRRGVITLTVLANLADEQYGYWLLTRLSEHGLEIDQGTLYPLLRRLEAQGLLESTWRIEEARPRRYYRLSETGREALPLLQKEWERLSTVVDGILKQEE